MVAKSRADGTTDRMPSPAVGRTLTVLETLAAADDGLTLTALAKATGIPLATCAAIVYTLEDRGYATRKVVGRSHFWRLTLRLYGLTTQLVRKVDLSTLAQPELRLIADTLGMPAHVGVLNGADVVYVAKAATPGFIQFDTYPGKVAPFDLTALGRAIAAHLPDDELAPLLKRLSKGTGPKAGDATPKVFLARLAEVRERGYAVEDEEEQADISCVAAPFFHGDGRVAGAVGITGFARELTGDRVNEAGELVVRQAKRVSSKLGY
jgi:DNA-binding IclR family transcriptional regulator